MRPHVAPFELLTLAKPCHRLSSTHLARPCLLQQQQQRLYSSSLGRPPRLQAQQWCTTRQFSLGSIFKSRPTKLKEAAQQSPDNVEAQVAYFDYLKQRAQLSDVLAANTLVDLYEQRTGLFTDGDSKTRNIALLKDSRAWDAYIKGLVSHPVEKGGIPAGDKISAASEKRNAILASFATSPTATPPDSISNDSKSNTAEPNLSNEQLASAVLSKGGSHTVKVLNAKEDAQPHYSGSTASAGAAASTSSAAATAVPRNSEPIRVIVEEAKGSLVLKAVRFILGVLVWSFISLTIISLLIDSSGLMRASTSRGPAQFQPASGSKKVTFADVHGCEEAKDELQEVVDFLKNPAKFSALGGKMPKGVLLTGPPGTGKTLLARAVAGEAGVSFLFASGSEFDELFVGVGAKRVRELFAAARKNAPCIIFIDELDAIGSKRSPRDAQHMRQTLNQLLTELDGFTQSEGVILLGATNLPNLLDKALTRPGRFDRHVAVPLPDVRGRLSILQHHVKSIKVASGVDMIRVARGTPGFSGAQLENLVNQAAVKASKEGSDVVTLQHIEWAKDKILMGAERLSAVITPESRRKTAFHEAGHTLVAIYTQGAMPLHRVTVIPRGHSLGHTMQLPEMDRDSESFLELRARIDVAMGGRAAEEVVFGKENITSGASSDIKAASDVANLMIRHYGFSDKLGTVDLSEDEKLSTETRHLIESEVKNMIDGAAARAMSILTTKSDELNRLADALVQYETLNLEEVKKVIKGETLSKSII